MIIIGRPLVCSRNDASRDRCNEMDQDAKFEILPSHLLRGRLDVDKVLRGECEANQSERNGSHGRSSESSNE